MDSLLNAPLWLLVIVALVGVGLLFNGLRSGQEGLRKAAFILFILVAALLAMKWFVPTDQKKVEQKTRDLLTAIGSGSWDKAGPMLRHASMLNWQGDELTAAARSAAQLYHLASIRVNSLDVKKEPQVISVHAAVTTRHDSRDYDSVPSTWTFEYQKRGNEWVLTRIVPERIGFGTYTLQGTDIETILRGMGGW